MEECNNCGEYVDEDDLEDCKIYTDGGDVGLKSSKFRCPKCGLIFDIEDLVLLDSLDE